MILNENIIPINSSVMRLKIYLLSVSFCIYIIFFLFFSNVFVLANGRSPSAYVYDRLCPIKVKVPREVSYDLLALLKSNLVSPCQGKRLGVAVVAEFLHHDRNSEQS